MPGGTRQRIGLAPRLVEGAHQLAPEAFPQRLILEQRLELGYELGVPTEVEVGLDALLEGLQAQLV